MDKIRLGNDIEMRWSIFTRDGDNKVPYNLEGRALTLSVVNRTGESEIEFFAEGNIVTGVFRGRDQRILGKHGVILRENNGKDGMRTIDACDAFELVACSCEEALGSSGTIQLFHLTFDSTIGAITGTIDPILNYEAEQAEAERKANEIIRKANEQQRIDNEKQRNVNEILRNTAEEERESAEQERRVKEDLRKADEAERKTNEESRVQSESERVSSEEERLYAESIRVANENARIASEAKRAEAETARIEAEDKRIVSEKNRLSAESSRIANEDSRRANEDSRLSAEAKRVSAEEERVSAELERKAKFASMVVQSTGEATDKVMSQKSVTEALKEKQEKLVAGDNITIEGNVISSTGGGSIDLSAYAKQADVDAALAGKANLQHHHTVADITDFPELYYDATAFFASEYPSDKYGELLEAVKAKKTVYATLDEGGNISYVFFTSLANSDASSSRVLLTTIFVDGSYLYLNTFVLQQSGMTPLRESITGKADKATTLAGYGIGDAYTKSELDALLKGKQSILTDTDGSYGQRVVELEKKGIASEEKLTELATEEITPDRIYKEKYRYEYKAIEPDEIKENYRIKGYTTTAPEGKIITGTSEINGVYLHIYTIGDKKNVRVPIPDYSAVGFDKSILAFVGSRNNEDGYCMRYFTFAQIQANTYGCFEIKDNILTIDVDAWRQNGVGIISYFDVSKTNQIYYISTNDTDRLEVSEAKEFSYKLSDFKWLEQNIAEVVLPGKIIGATGIEMNLYKDNALLYTNIDSVCAVKFIDFPAGAFECKTRFRCKPTTTRNSNPQFSVFLNQFKNADIVKNVNLRIVDSSVVSGKSLNVLVIGDSKVNGGRLSSELRKQLTANGATPNFIGTIKSDAFNIYHEGRSGWTSADYTKPTTKTNYPNAFWDGSKFNFTYYMTQNGYTGVDYVFINLGTNDYASSVNLGKLDYIDDFISNIYTMVSSIRQYDANVPIVIGLAEGVCTYQWSSSNDNYLYNLNTRARLLNKAAIAEWDNRESEKLFVCPLYLSMDMENDYVMTDVPLSDRDETHNTGKTRKSVTDTMHQSAVGYGKNADYMFAMIAYIESGM